jgi:hypothetical protein
LGQICNNLLADWGGGADVPRTERVLGTRLGLVDGSLLLALREREAVGHLQGGVYIETQKLAGHKLGQVLTAVLDNLEHNLLPIDSWSITRKLSTLRYIGIHVGRHCDRSN